jgi:signal transduction histidine kinase
VTVGPGSIAFRVVALTTVLVAAAVIAIASIVSALYREAAEQSFDRELSAHLFNLIGAVGASADGRLQGAPELGDVRFKIPRSGWYWSVDPVSGLAPQPLKSISLTEPVASPDPNAVPFDASFRRAYAMNGIEDEQVRVVEGELGLAEADQVARFRVMGNYSELLAEIAAFRNRLFLYLGLFGLVAVLINTIVILFGLRPLGAVREALERIRTGKAEKLEGAFATEITPLADEINALIDGNRGVLERYRTQVGNLAHSLKTPLAVLSNEANAIGGKHGKLVSEQTARMLTQVQHYLQRARIAAQKDSVVFRTPVDPLLERMVRVIAKLNQKLSVDLQITEHNMIFSGEAQDFEEIAGNLLENAGKWAKSKIRVSATPATIGQRPAIRLAIEDDGPGIAPGKHAEALKRGMRLDETKPGTGLGLSIVADMTEEYGGSLTLGESALGGLSVTVTLPRATH